MPGEAQYESDNPGDKLRVNSSTVLNGRKKREKLAAKNGLPPVIQSTRDWFEYGGAGSGNTLIKQADEALNPGGKNEMLALLLKSRISPEIERDVAWLLSEAVSDGDLSLSNLDLHQPSIPTVFAVIKVAISYAAVGKGRAELVEVLRGMTKPRGPFNRAMGRRNGYDQDGFE